MADTTDRLREVDALAMPPRRPRWERVQVNARVRVEIEHVLQRFVRDHDTTVQSCVDLALEEFLSARGYALADELAGGGDVSDRAYLVAGPS
jgi:hypothetical protein